MPMQALHQQVAQIALDTLSHRGFALAGGNALIVHGLVDRPTHDVDLFTNEEDSVEATTGDVEDALRAAGFQVDRHDILGGLDGVWADFGTGLAEWLVTDPDGSQLILQTSYYDRTRNPVAVVEVGPVLALEDAVGSKVAALVNRVEVRDYVDVAAARTRFTVDQLIDFASRLDPGIRCEDYAAAGVRLDTQMPDQVFAYEGFGPDQITWIRNQFADWPRS